MSSRRSGRWIAGVLALLGCGCGAPGTAPRPADAGSASTPAAPAPVVERAPEPVAEPAPEPEAAEPAAPQVARVVDPAERFVVPLADAPRFFVGHHPAPREYFTPGEDEIMAFEHDLPAFLAGSDDARARGIVAGLPTYRRQFIGVVLDEGRLVFGNYFCRDAGKPATAPMIVDDGGPCYFNVFYEPGSEVFWRLTVNGEG